MPRALRKKKEFLLDGCVDKAELKDKFIFWAIDGTLAPYRFNGHLSDPEGSDMGASPSEVRGRYFKKRKPSPFMQSVLMTCGAKEQFAVEKVFSVYEAQDKGFWLSVYFPMISEPLFIWDIHPDETKLGAIIKHCAENDIDLSDAVYVDSSVDCLRLAEREGIVSYHISSFLDYCW